MHYLYVKAGPQRVLGIYFLLDSLNRAEEIRYSKRVKCGNWEVKREKQDELEKRQTIFED